MRIVTWSWLRLAVVLVALVAVLAGLRFGIPLVTSTDSLAAQESPAIPTVTPEEWDSVPPGGDVIADPSRLTVVLVTASEDAGIVSGASGASGVSAVPRTSSVTNPATNEYRFPSSVGFRHLALKDGRVVFLPDDVEIVGTASVFECWSGSCPSPPIHELRHSNGATVGVDGNGVIFQAFSDGTHDPSAFPFLQAIWPQNSDAPGEWRP